MDGVNELARLLKERENIEHMGIQVGEVIAPLPDLQVKLNENILLTKDHLRIAYHLCTDYQRPFQVEGTIKLADNDCGQTGSVGVGDHGAHQHTLETVNIETEMTANGTIKLTDFLKAGDEVILIPTQDEQTYFLIDKVVKL